MKKLILTFAAMSMMSIAAAQTDPKQVPQSPQTPSTPMVKDTDVQTKPVSEKEIQKDAVTNQPKRQGEVQPRKDELKTKDHVKSSGSPAVSDTIKPTMRQPSGRRQ